MAPRRKNFGFRKGRKKIIKEVGVAPIPSVGVARVGVFVKPKKKARKG